MKTKIINILFFVCLMSLSITELLPLHAGDAGSRASFTRGGWAGAKYTAMGQSADVVVDDVFAIYWNPAGLAELIERKTLTPEDIKKKAIKGDVENILETDLMDFSEDRVKKSIFQIGMSGALLSEKRNAGFVGVAFNLFSGIMGVGMYSIVSTGIDQYDDSGNFINSNLNYIAGMPMLSYGFSTGMASIGFTFKGVYEQIGDVQYGGAGLDFGTQVDLLPFLKVAFVARDLGTGLMPLKSTEGIDKTYDLAAPTLRMSVAVKNDTNDSLSITFVKKLEQDDYEIHAGLQYHINSNFIFFLGMSESSFSSGMKIKVSDFDISYSFIIDKIDYGYNNMVSLLMFF